MNDKIQKDLIEMKKKLSEYIDKEQVTDYVGPITLWGFKIFGGRKI